jgi:hypothetical protein
MVGLVAGLASPTRADPFFFSTGDVNGLMASASRPDSTGKFEIETGDDFVLNSATRITSATFTGLVTGSLAAPSVTGVAVEIYRVFPNDSNTVRTPRVPTRVNSPSDVAFTSRDAGSGTLTFSTTLLQSTFTAANSVQPGGIHPSPGQTTGGNGPVTGQEVEFTVKLTTPLDLPADHYFFVPQVQVDGGEFFWLSSVRPIVAPGTPFLPDLQAWTRDAALDPDWLRIGTDIVGGSPAPTFNEAFTLTGVTIPEPVSAALLAPVCIGMAALRRRTGQRGR